MYGRVLLALIVGVALIPDAGLAQRQAGPGGVVRPPSGAEDASRRDRNGASRRRGRPTTRMSKFAELQRLSKQIDSKIRRLGPWESQHEEFTKTFKREFMADSINPDAEQAFQDLVLKTNELPPWDFQGRINTVTDLVAERYGFGEDTKRNFRRLLIGQNIKLGLKYGPQMMKLANEILGARLSGEPITSEQVARWTKKLRPLLEKAYQETMQDLEPHLKTLSPEQQAAIKGDLKVVSHHMDGFVTKMKTKWERGRWEAADWGLEDDPIQMGKAGKDALAKTRELQQRITPNAMTGDARRGPMRLGETPGNRFLSKQDGGSSLPDESKWVAYVRQFCDRYDLNKAQRASAMGILKDLQEQAQSYRTSRKEEIERLEREMREAESSDIRRDAQMQLRELMSGLDVLFGDLKARLDSIPTEDQMRRGG